MCPYMSPPSGLHYLYTWDMWALHWQPRRVTPATVGVLSSHLDRLFVEYVIPGLEQGFCIRFNGMRTIRSASRNMASAYATPQVVSDYLQADVTLVRFLGPLSPLFWTGWSSVSLE